MAEVVDWRPYAAIIGCLHQKLFIAQPDIRPNLPRRLSVNPVAMVDPTDGAFTPDLDECHTERRFHSRAVLGARRLPA